MRRMRFFASRNAREILRDPISVGFGVAFPILLLLLLRQRPRSLSLPLSR